MRGVSSAVVVRFRLPGFHCWPNAPDHRGYLSTRHRHLFHFEVGMTVLHHDREVECHDLQEFCIGVMKADGGEHGALSCEALGAKLMNAIIGKYGRGRAVTVSVLEDGEVGAVTTHEPAP